MNIPSLKYVNDVYENMGKELNQFRMTVARDRQSPYANYVRMQADKDRRQGEADMNEYAAYINDMAAIYEELPDGALKKVWGKRLVNLVSASRPVPSVAKSSLAALQRNFETIQKDKEAGEKTTNVTLEEDSEGKATPGRKTTYRINTKGEKVGTVGIANIENAPAPPADKMLTDKKSYAKELASQFLIEMTGKEFTFDENERYNFNARKLNLTPEQRQMFAKIESSLLSMATQPGSSLETLNAEYERMRQSLPKPSNEFYGGYEEGRLSPQMQPMDDVDAFLDEVLGSIK